MGRLTITVALLLVVSPHLAPTSALSAGAHFDSTISLEGTSSSSSSSKKSANSHQLDLTSTDSLAPLIETGYLESLDSANQPDELGAHQAQPIDEISDNSLASLKSTLKKSRKQAENQIKLADWWSRLNTKGAASKPQASDDIKPPRGRGIRPAAPSFYKEQPLSQNPILTARNQLLAIREKHRLLMTRSVSQLMQLDQKLIDSYKQCLRRKMPLYAGMLYRTRDFVVRMANEVKHERQVLEALAGQAQRVLRQKMANRTLIKDYNRLASIPTWLHDDAAADYSDDVKRKRRVTKDLALPATVIARAVSLSTAGVTAASLIASQQRQQTTVKRDSSRLPFDETHNQQQWPAAISGEPQTLVSLSKVTGDADKMVRANSASASASTSTSTLATRSQQRVGTKNLLVSEKNSLLARREAPTYAAESNPGPERDVKTHSQHQDLFGHGLLDGHSSTQADPTESTTASTTSTTTRRAKQRTYTVHINEVNLKRELVKTQALIDRINTSSTELMGVVDDIFFLFKLTSGDYSLKKGLSTSGKTSKHDKMHGGQMLAGIANSDTDQKKAKRLLKSPFKVFFERYGKLTNQSPESLMTVGNPTTPSDAALSKSSSRPSIQNENSWTLFNLADINTNSLPEPKPLFDPANVSTYTEPADLELGFDAPTILET